MHVLDNNANLLFKKLLLNDVEDVSLLYYAQVSINDLGPLVLFSRISTMT